VLNKPPRGSEQSGFQHGRLTVGQVTSLIQDIEDSFSAEKAGALFVDLTAVSDTVWQGWGTCGPHVHLIWPVLEFSSPDLEHKIASKQSSIISRYLDSMSR